MTVVLCAHCEKVNKEWSVQPGDAERIKASQDGHTLRCSTSEDVRLRVNDGLRALAEKRREKAVRLPRGMVGPSAAGFNEVPHIDQILREQKIEQGSFGP